MKPNIPEYGHQPKAYAGLPKEEVLKLRNKHLTPALITYHDDPLMIVEGSMQYVYDEAGRRYLDAFAGIVTVSCGHSHPAILKAAHEQMDTLVHTTTIYANQEVVLYGQAHAEKLPGDLSVCYVVNSG